MAYWSVGLAGAAVSAAAVVVLPTSDVVMAGVVEAVAGVAEPVAGVAEVDGCVDSAVSESLAAAVTELFPAAVVGGGSLAVMESVCRAAAAGEVSTPSGAVIGWPELSDEADETDGVDVLVCVESVELGLLGPVPDTMVVVTVRSALDGSADPVVVDGVVSAVAAV
jgi:hypothetical protein